VSCSGCVLLLLLLLLLHHNEVVLLLLHGHLVLVKLKLLLLSCMHLLRLKLQS